MNKQKLEKISIGKKPSYIELSPLKNISKFKRMFAGKFSLIVMIITYQGDVKFYLVNVLKGVIKLGRGYYWIQQEKILKTNCKQNMICFDEDNPIARSFLHERNPKIDSQQLEKFMDSNFVDMAFRSTKKKNREGLGVVGWIIIIFGLLFVIIILMALLGIIDVSSFIMPRG